MLVARASLSTPTSPCPCRREFLREVKAQMVAVRVMDESAEEVVREYARRQVEGRLSKALDAIKATGKNKDKRRWLLW